MYQYLPDNVYQPFPDNYWTPGYNDTGRWFCYSCGGWVAWWVQTHYCPRPLTYTITCSETGDNVYDN